MAAPVTTKRVRVFKLKVSAWDDPKPLETAINAALLSGEKVIAVIPGPKMTACLIITEQ